MWSSLRKSLHDLDRDHLLEMVGLEARRSSAERLVPAFALFGAGVLVGVGVGLMVAPRPGRELRHDLRGRLAKGVHQAEVMVPAAPEPVSAHAPS